MGRRAFDRHRPVRQRDHRVGGGTGTIHAASLPAGGSWTPAHTLATNYRDSVSNFFGGRVVADSAGTFVIAWTDGTTRTLNVLTSPPGGGFGPAATLAPNVSQINNLQIARFRTALGAGKAARRRRYGICPMWRQRAYGESGTWRRSLVRLSPGRSSYKRDLTWTRRETFRANPRRNG
jgi:hypothetical protein